MSKESRFLITTALESSWQNEKPALFLGDWCLCYDRKEIWEKIDNIVLPFHWNDQQKLEHDYNYLSVFYEKFLPQVSKWLNKFHGVEHSERYWRILIGPWITYFSQIVFERWESVQRAIELYDITGTIIVQMTEVEYVPADMIDFRGLMTTDRWNHFIFSEVVKRKIRKENIIYRSCEKKNNLSISSKSTFPISIKLGLFSLFLPMLSRLMGKLTKYNKYFIGASYLGLVNEIKLNLRFSQLPIFYKENAPRVIQPNPELRKSLKLECSAITPFEQFLVEILPIQIPTCFLEGYCSMIGEVERLPYPQSPKVIFTSNFLTYDSLTMAYTAKHIDLGAKLVHGQHGGYGLPKFMSAEEHERTISDRFLTWGWTDGAMNIIPVGILKSIKGYSRKPGTTKKHLLLIRGVWPRYTFRLDSGSGLRLNEAIKGCLNFASFLPKAIRNDYLTVRLFSTDFGYGEKAQWQKVHPGVHLNDGSDSIKKLVSNSKLVIYTYNIGTGYLEYMSANIPTIAFWDMKASPVRDSAIPYFEELKRIGIFHDTPESAAEHVAAIWDDVDAWWNSKDVRSARERFCRQYAYLPDNLLNNVENALRDVLIN